MSAGRVVVAHNFYAVVVRIPGPILPDTTYDYCNRAKGRWVRMTPGPSSANFGQVAALRLAGRYVGYEVRVSGPEMPMFLWDTRTRHNQVADGYGVLDALSRGVGQGVASPDPDFQLSPNGVLVRIEALTSNHSPIPPQGAIDALTLSGSTRLDSASSPSDLANLQLYDCTAGCTSNATVVAWTNSGAQRYAKVTG